MDFKSREGWAEAAEREQRQKKGEKKQRQKKRGGQRQEQGAMGRGCGKEVAAEEQRTGQRQRSREEWSEAEEGRDGQREEQGAPLAAAQIAALLDQHLCSGCASAKP